MTRSVQLHSDFEDDFRRLVTSIVAHGEPSWVDTLVDGVRRAMQLLGRFPAAGTLLDRRGTVVLRKLILPKGPYVAWYVLDEADRKGDLWLVRLFHARQKRPLPRARRYDPS